jgi:hypothetical protein
MRPMDECVLENNRLSLPKPSLLIGPMTWPYNASVASRLERRNEPLRPPRSLENNIVGELEGILASIRHCARKEMVPHLRRGVGASTDNHRESGQSVLILEKEGVIIIDANVELILVSWTPSRFKGRTRSRRKIAVFVSHPGLIPTTHWNQNPNFH